MLQDQTRATGWVNITIFPIRATECKKSVGGWYVADNGQDPRDIMHRRSIRSSAVCYKPSDAKWLTSAG